MALTKAEKQILKDFGNDPNYRIDVDARNKIVAIPLHPAVQHINTEMPLNNETVEVINTMVGLVLEQSHD